MRKIFLVLLTVTVWNGTGPVAADVQPGADSNNNLLGPAQSVGQAQREEKTVRNWVGTQNALAAAQQAGIPAIEAADGNYRIVAQDAKNVNVIPVEPILGTAISVNLQDPRLAGTEIKEVQIAGIRFLSFAHASGESPAASIAEISLQDGNKLYLFLNRAVSASSPVAVKPARGVLTPDGKKLIYSELTYSTPSVVVRDLTKPFVVLTGTQADQHGVFPPGTRPLSAIARTLVSNDYVVVSTLSPSWGPPRYYNELTVFDLKGPYAVSKSVRITVPNGESATDYSFISGNIEGTAAKVRLYNGNIYEIELTAATPAAKLVSVDPLPIAPITQQGLIDKIRIDLFAGIELERVDGLETGHADMVAAVAIEKADAYSNQNRHVLIYSTSGKALLQANYYSSPTKPFQGLKIDDTGKIVIIREGNTKMNFSGIPQQGSLFIYARSSDQAPFQFYQYGSFLRDGLTVIDSPGPEIILRAYDPQFGGPGGRETVLKVNESGKLESRENPFIPADVLAVLPRTVSNPGFVIEQKQRDGGGYAAKDLNVFTLEGRYVATLTEYSQWGSPCDGGTRVWTVWGMGLPDVSPYGRYAIAASKTQREDRRPNGTVIWTQSIRVVNALTGAEERTIALKSPLLDEVREVRFVQDSATLIRVRYASGEMKFYDARTGLEFSLPAEGALTPLAQYLGPGQMALVSWKPVDFQKAVQAGFTTVWLGIGGFLKMTDSERQAVLAQAKQAGLRTLGFIGGDPEWANPNRPEQAEFAVAEYRRLIGELDSFISRQETPDALRFAFATDIEPYTKGWWDGDLSQYSALIEKITPVLQEFYSNHRNQISPPEMLITRFEPFWWRNGHVTEDGKTIRGLRDFSSSNVASMTYRDTASQIASVSQSIRARSQQTSGMGFLLGVETKPASPGIPAHITFDGQFQTIAGELLAVIRGMSEPDRQRLRGVFVHAGKAEVDQTLDSLLATPPAGPPASSSVLAVRSSGRYFVRFAIDGGSRAVYLKGLDSSAKIVFVTSRLIKVTTASGRVYFVLI